MSIKEYLLNLKEKLGFFKKEEGKSAEKILSDSLTEEEKQVQACKAFFSLA